jgi:hypothetical protein
MKKQPLKLLRYFLFALWFVLPLSALADTAFVPLATIPSGPLAQLYATPNNGDFSNFINSLFKFTLALGAIAAVLRIAYAGYLYMGQSDMWSHKGQAKTIIGDVTLGLLLLLGIWLILNQINPDIVKLNGIQQIQLNKVNVPGSNSGATTPTVPQTTVQTISQPAAPSGNANVDTCNNGGACP